MLKKIAQVKDGKSFSNKLRAKRFIFFLDLIKDLPRPINILDIGGTVNFWEKMGGIDNNNFKITLFNLEKEEVNVSNIKSLKGELDDLNNFENEQFDIVFSNSTIEHLFNLNNQKSMAGEIRRIGKKYFIQTPNKYFPIEPHFLFPFFQFFPLGLKVWLLRNFNLGWRKRQKNKSEALKSVTEIKLLSKKDLKKLFPEGEIWKERFFGFTKSLVTYKGF